MAKKEDYLGKAKAQEIVNEALDSEIGLTRLIGSLLDKNLQKQGRLNAAVQDRARMLGRITKEEKDQDSISKRIAATENDIANATAKIAKANAGDKRIKKEIHQTNLAIASVRLAQLKVEEKIEKTTKAIKQALTVGGVLAVGLSVLKKFDATLTAIGTKFGSLNKLGRGFQQDIALSEVTATTLGFSLDDVTSSVSSLASEFGVSLDTAATLNRTILDTARGVGLTADEGTKLFGVLMQTAGLSSEQAERLSESTFQLALANKVAPAAVLQDIAGSSEVVAKFTKGSADNLAEAAVQARQFGLTLGDIAGSARGVLNFQQSLQKELTASVLIGRSLNLQRAREAAFAKDLVGFQKELKRQLDGTNFESLDPLSQEAVAEALEMTVDQVAKLNSGTKSLKGVVGDFNFSDIVGQEALGQLSKLLNAFAALSKTALNTLGPALTDILTKFTSFLGNEEKVKSLGNTMLVVADAFLLVATHLNKVIGAFVGLKAGQAAFALLGSKAFKAGIASLLPVAAQGAAALGPAGPLLFAGILGGLVAAATSMITSVDDFKSGPGGINFMSGPAGAFKLNPRDSVLATTNAIPVNDIMSTPAGGIQPNTGGGGGTMTAVVSGGDLKFIMNRIGMGGDSADNSYVALRGG